MSDLKILVCGDVCGNFRTIFSRVDTILKKKGSFEYLFCVGNFFGSTNEELEDLKTGKIKVPITTYVLGPNEASHEKFYSCLDSISDITYLGKKGCLTGISGLKIAYLSGIQSEERELPGRKSFGAHSNSKNKDNIYFSRTDIDEMINSLESETVIDILLTSQWPKSITKYAVSLSEERELPGRKSFGARSNSKNKDNIYFSRTDIDEMINNLESETVIDILLTSQWPKSITKYAVSLDNNASSIDKCSSPLISLLAKKLKPRYHFCGLAGVYYERVPYRNHAVLQETPVHVTRFFALAPVNNTQKQKWLYAFNVSPARSLSFKQLTENSGPATVCPYESNEIPDELNDQFFFSTESSNQSKKRPHGNSDHQSKRMSIDSNSCWFCLTNSNVEKQLIISIGTHCYIALPKGVLVPEHVLIVPVKHAISSVELADDVSDEVEKFKKSLASYFHDRNKDVVFFERNYSSPHLQIQAVPVPKQLKTEIVEALFDEAKDYNLEFNELPNFSNIKQVVHPKKPYFYFELMLDKKIEAKYLHIIKNKFPLQFGRSVLAGPEILNVTERIDWKKCQDSKTVEKEMTEKMRKEFQPYECT